MDGGGVLDRGARRSVLHPVSLAVPVAAGLFLLAGAIYAGGAVGVEHWTGADVNSLHYNMWTTLEEGMEMAGVVVFIYALLDFMPGSGDGGGSLRLELSSDV